MNYNIPFSDKFLHLKHFNIYAKMIYPLLSFRMRMSLSKGDAFYNFKGGYFYVVYQVADLAEFLGLSSYQIRTGLNFLDTKNFIVKHWAGHYYRYELPKFYEFDTSHIKSFNPLHKKFLCSHRERRMRTNKDSSNTVNTEPRKSQPKFKESSLASCWRDSARKLGLTVDTIHLISEFSSTYNQSAYNIAGYIKEARDVIANQYHVKKLTRRFESNANVKNKLAHKLKILFTHIVSKSDKKARLSHYAGFLVNSLKRFFKWAFGQGADVTVKPKTDDRKPIYSNKYRKRKPIIEHLPQWWQDQQHGKNVPKKASGLLNKLNRANLALLDTTDSDSHGSNKDKVMALKKRVNYYRKLWDEKQVKPRPVKKQQSNISQKLPRTSQTLQNKIKMRLRNLGEC